MDDCDRSPDFDIDIDYDIEIKKELLDEQFERSLLMKKFLREQENEKSGLTYMTDIDGGFNHSRNREDPTNKDYPSKCPPQINQIKKEEIKLEFISDTDSYPDLETFDSLGGENGGNTIVVNKDVSQNDSQSDEDIAMDPKQTLEDADSNFDSCFDDLEDDDYLFEEENGGGTFVKNSSVSDSNLKQSVSRKRKKSNIKQKLVNCTVCDYSCSNNSRLLRHMRTHTKERNYLCSMCDFKCTQSADLRVHLRTHTGEKLFHCQFCDYSAARNNALQRHLRTHTGDKPHNCTLCDYRCIEAADLRAHMFKHKGIKPFSCKICDFRAAKSSDLVKHVRIHTGEKPYKCLLCDYRCTRAYHLKSHMKRHTKLSKKRN